MLLISENATISPLADIEESILGTKIVIEDGVHIDSFVKIKPSGGVGDVYIGKNSYLNSGVVIYTGNGVIIGEDVLIAANTTFAPTNHEYQNRYVRIRLQGFQTSRGGILIEDDVWVGANSILLDGAILRKGCVVGANSLVNGELEPYSVNVGSPTKIVGYRQ